MNWKPAERRSTRQSTACTVTVDAPSDENSHKHSFHQAATLKLTRLYKHELKGLFHKRSNIKIVSTQNEELLNCDEFKAAQDCRVQKERNVKFKRSRLN